ncbi:hypothetical protein GGR51DRAFT_499588 [Nemania sp. FL0031]|nr:hypothetical protein GGR51DRAFT_499588 [Nemania sp. FL0031]
MSKKNNPYTWHFAVHDACWELLGARLAGRFSTQSLAARLFALLYNTTQPLDYKYISAIMFRYEPVTTFSGPHDLHDPTKPFDLCDKRLETACGGLLPSPTPILPKIYIDSDDKHDIFGNLPNEIIMLILAILPSGDICNLRLASRHVCCHASPHLLSQEFWASRFGPEGECGFLFANGYCARPSGRVDWRALYFKVALACDLSPNFRTRRRLWSVLGHWAHRLCFNLADKNVVLDSS